MIKKIKHAIKCICALFKTILLMFGLLLIVIGWKLGIHTKINVESPSFTGTIDSPQKLYDWVKCLVD